MVDVEFVFCSFESEEEGGFSHCLLRADTFQCGGSVLESARYAYIAKVLFWNEVNVAGAVFKHEDSVFGLHVVGG